jgi:hypothetical protein
MAKEARSPPGISEDVETAKSKLRRTGRNPRFANMSRVTSEFQSTNRATLVVGLAYYVDRILIVDRIPGGLPSTQPGRSLAVPLEEHENNHNKDGMEQLHRNSWPSSEATRTMRDLVVAS